MKGEARAITPQNQEKVAAMLYQIVRYDEEGFAPEVIGESTSLAGAIQLAEISGECEVFEFGETVPNSHSFEANRGKRVWSRVWPKEG